MSKLVGFPAYVRLEDELFEHVDSLDVVENKLSFKTRRQIWDLDDYGDMWHDHIRLHILDLERARRGGG